MDPALFSVEAPEGVKAVTLVQLTCQYDLLSQPPLPVSFEFIDDLQFRLEVLTGQCIYFMIGREKDADEQWQLRIQAAIRCIAGVMVPSDFGGVLCDTRHFSRGVLHLFRAATFETLLPASGRAEYDRLSPPVRARVHAVLAYTYFLRYMSPMAHRAQWEFNPPAGHSASRFTRQALRDLVTAAGYARDSYTNGLIFPVAGLVAYALITVAFYLKIELSNQEFRQFHGLIALRSNKLLRDVMLRLHMPPPRSGVIVPPPDTVTINAATAECLKQMLRHVGWLPGND
ncbi:hypothetical protein C8Q74DRAFT_592306 [Fomes fomentarius]|nr:hypothetical protein C8Q74DRAFT_592306 [Fomes fomentarius]